MIDLNKKTPVTVLTGYLGAGKTTFLNRILSENHSKKFAVIVNEFGELGIDHDLVIGADEEVFEMNNGCVCCSVRGDLIRVISGLSRRTQRFDSILVETTGLAYPASVAQAFLVDPDIAARTKIDNVVTVVDAKHIHDSLAYGATEIEDQIAFADIIILNKSDLVGDEKLNQVEYTIRHINHFARVVRGKEGVEGVVGAGRFDLERLSEINQEDRCACGQDACPHGPRGGTHASEPRHDSSIQSIALRTLRPLNPNRFESWVTALSTAQGQNLLRYKGILYLKGNDNQFAFQGVHMTIEGRNLKPWPTNAPRESRLVFIGRHLDKEALQAGFTACEAA